MLKAPSAPQASLTSLLELVRSPSTVLMFLAEEHPREVLGGQASLAGLVPLEEIDFVKTRNGL